MKVLKYILFLLLILTIGISIYVAVQPNSYEVTRERTIEAPVDVIYNNLIDFKNWERWSPWVEKEPTTEITYPDQTKGVGGSFSWEDDDGVGNMKTLSTSPNISIEQEMQFGDYAPSNIYWTFEPTPDNKTKVIWQMKEDKIPFMYKAYSSFSGGFDNMIGPDFERGLEKLDSIVVNDMKMYNITINGATEHGGGFYIFNSTSCRIDEFEEKMQEILSTVSAFAIQNNITMAGAPYVSFTKWDIKNNATIFSCCIPTTSRVIATDSDILTGQLEPFRAVKTTLKGNYSNLKEAWDKTMAYIPKQGFEFTDAGPMLEVYITNPKDYPNPADWVTELYIAIKE